MAKAKNTQARKSLKKVADYHAVFNTPQGRAVLYDLMETHNVLRSTYTKDSGEALFKEGERNVVLRILTLVKTDMKQLIERIEEHEKQME
jgi:hypothetical protein